MSSAIVTTSYRYKRPPRKKKRVVLTGSAIVTSKRKAEGTRPLRNLKRAVRRSCGG